MPKTFQNEQIKWWQDCAKLVERLSQTNFSELPILEVDARRLLERRPIKIGEVS